MKKENKLEQLSLMDLLQLREATDITMEYYVNICEANMGIDKIVEDYNDAAEKVLTYTRLKTQIFEQIKNKVNEYL